MVPTICHSCCIIFLRNQFVPPSWYIEKNTGRLVIIVYCALYTTVSTPNWVNRNLQRRAPQVGRCLVAVSQVSIYCECGRGETIHSWMGFLTLCFECRRGHAAQAAAAGASRERIKTGKEETEGADLTQFTKLLFFSSSGECIHIHSLCGWW